MAVKREANVHSTAVSGVFAAVRWELASVKGKVAEIEGEVAEVKGEVEEVKGEMEEVKEEVAEVKEKMAEVKGELAAAVAEKRWVVENEVDGQISQLCAPSVSSCALGQYSTSLTFPATSPLLPLVLLPPFLILALPHLNVQRHALHSHAPEDCSGNAAAGFLSRRFHCVFWRIKAASQATELSLGNLKGLSDGVLHHASVQRASSTSTGCHSLSSGSHKIAWERIKAASQATELSLGNLKGLSDGVLHHVAEMTHLKSIDLHYEPGFFWWMPSSGFSAEGIKHLYRLTHFEKLDLKGTGITDSALEGIESLTEPR
ncbi:unnamed protein product [Closterium sp. Yama58-4]|nr:unnamed protein product [Closterium sp. Yama58-4]